MWENLLVSGNDDKADLWVVRAKDSLSTEMELLQGIEHHVDQEQEGVEKRQSLSLSAKLRHVARKELQESCAEKCLRSAGLTCSRICTEQRLGGLVPEDHVFLAQGDKNPPSSTLHEPPSLRQGLTSDRAPMSEPSNRTRARTSLLLAYKVLPKNVIIEKQR